MSVALVLAPIAAYLLLYAPGHYLLRLTANPRSGSRLFREVLLSVCCTSWVGFVLAEIGIYSLPLLLGCLACVAFAAAVFGRRRSVAPYVAGDLVGLAVVALSWAWLSPPLDTRVLGSDSSGYIAAGVHLSRHGSLVIHDPTLPLLPPLLKLALFPTLTHTPFAPPYIRLLGSMTVSDLTTDEVLPAFHHLVIVWVAIFHGVGGSAAAHWAITLFGGLSMWAMVEFAVLACGGVTAVAFFFLLSVSAIQGWYSRFLMPEIPSQFFLWSGLAIVCLWRSSQRRADAVLAGLAFGMAGLMRAENAVFALPALLFGLFVAGGYLRRQGLWMLGCAAALWIHAVAHLLHFRTHYAVILESLVLDGLALLAATPWSRLASLAAGICALAVVAYRLGPPALRTMLPLFVLTALVSTWGQWQQGWAGIGLLTAYQGVPTVIIGFLGLAWFARATRANDVGRVVCCGLVALALAQFLIAPHATPVPIWLVRRAAAIALPALCLGAAVVCVGLSRRLHWVVAASIFGLALAGQVGRFNQLRWTPYYEGGSGHVRALADRLPAGACVLYDGPLTGWGFAQALWAERDMPAYLVRRFDSMLVLQVLLALDGWPVYWVTESRWTPPQPFGFSVALLGTYSFSMLTPTLDEKTEPGMSNEWNRTIALYEFRPLEAAPGK